MKPILKSFLLQLCWLPLLISIVIAVDCFIDMRNFYHLERTGIETGISELQKQNEKQDSINRVHEMQIQHLMYMQQNGIEWYRIETGNTAIYLSNTGGLEL